MSLQYYESLDTFDQSHEVLIQQRDTAESIVEVNASGNPFSITHDTPSDIVTDPINGSWATIRLIAETDFQFIDLHTSDNRMYQVIHNIGGSLNWKGFILQDQYQEQYKGPPYVNEFIAADQLGFLRSLAWDNADPSITFIENLDILLGATDLELDLYEAINVYEDSNAQTTADSPLDQNWGDNNVYESKTYYDVLKEILQKFTSIIKQDRGKWFIYRPNKANAAFQRRLWTWSGSYSFDSTELYDPIVSTTSAPPVTAVADLIRISGPGLMWINQAWRSYTINQSLDKIENNIPNGDFANWTGGRLDRWTRTGAIGEIQSGDKPKFFAKATHNVGRYLSTRFTTNSDRFKIKVSWNVFVQAGTSMDIYFQLALFGSAPNIVFYDFDIQAWRAFPPVTSFKRTYDNSGGSEAIVRADSLELVTSRTGQVGQSFLDIRMLSPVSATTTNWIIFESFGARIMKDTSVDETEEFVDDLTFDTEIDPRNNFVPPDIEVLAADAPADVLADTQNIYHGALFTNATKTIRSQNWKEDGGAFKPLVEVMQDVFSELYSDPQQVLSVMIMSKLIFSTTVIQEINNSNRLFMIRRATYDCVFGRWQVEAHEIGIGIGAILIDEGVPLLDEGEVMPDN